MQEIPCRAAKTQIAQKQQDTHRKNRQNSDFLSQETIFPAAFP